METNDKVIGYSDEFNIGDYVKVLCGNEGTIIDKSSYTHTINDYARTVVQYVVKFNDGMLEIHTRSTLSLVKPTKVEDEERDK